MREPVFTGVTQIGIVVRDLESTIRRYEDDYGVGPWERARIDLGDEHGYREYGQPARRSNRAGFAMIGQVMWELIEPLDDEGIYAQFLREKGEGVHHVAVVARDFDETVARAERSDGLVLSGEVDGVRVAFLPTERDLGVTFEVYSGMPGEREPVDD